MPTILGGYSIIQSSLVQTEGTSAGLPTGNTLEPQGSGEEVQLPMQEGFSTRVLATNFSAPHNILYGPDGALWITERVGKNITRIDPITGDRLSVMPVPNVHQSGGQDGLLGMTFDPDFNSTNYIYVAYTYDSDPSEGLGEDDVERRLKITRFTYNPEGQSIGDPVDLISGLSGSNDHNGGRMIFGPDGKLYYTIGDQGNNQFGRYCLPIRSQLLPTAEQIEAQDWTAYEGKVLRMNPDGSIPEDNPEINGVKSHIFTYGHRNPQGIAFGPNGDLYISEHGDRSDDELNRLEAGGNHGWPNVAGHNDEQAYQYANWSGAENCEELEFNNIPPFPQTVPVMNESEFNATANFVPPVSAFYTVGNDYNFSEPDGCGYVCWPTVAPSSVRLYTSDTIPGWNGTFLMTTLKAGRIFHLALNENGTELAGDPVELFRSENRYRDLTFSPDGRSIYVITDSAGPVQAFIGDLFPILEDPDSVPELIATIQQNPGSLLEFRYDGNNGPSRE
ncbi:MAG: PQQ-dependent sugar dehydrogenase [Thermoproteota archaeon]|nr:PQQ-dependent sugar dehydrogenase [Thermoproteota archaeon]